MEKSFYDINTLAKFIFIDNSNNHPIDLVIDEGCSNTKELFYICVELLTTGLKLLYGNEYGKVSLQDLTIEQLKVIKKKLLLAKIDFEIDMIDNKEILNDLETYLNSKENLSDDKNTESNDRMIQNLLFSVDDLEDNLPLNEYCFKIELEDRIYFVNFNLLNRN